MQEALSNNTLEKHGLITPADLASRDKPRDVANRRMRKTVRPVVWEPRRVKSCQGDPIH